ncbi:MAG: hypothetical protein ACFB4I_12995 [Cyanophyceae cyanobacterium]
MPSERSQPIKVNRILGTQPRLGPLPADQVLPWSLFTLFSYFICQGYYDFGWLPMVLLDGWLISTWWILTGERSWRFLSKIYPPVPRWERGCPKYHSFLEDHRSWHKPRRNSAKRGSVSRRTK